MNNRYICKAKRKDNGEWIEGLFSIRNFAGREYYAIERREKRLLSRISCDSQWTMQPYEVIPETVGQCTGLKDKNGKWIFEGDLLRFTNSDNEQSIYKVFYDDVYAGYRIQEIDLGGLDEMSNWEDSREYFEVIGNIHDNPELLEV